jgi:2-dehydro-3-deoxyphosphogluconate aldolase / (4S)-4-hydroxy-2-oxoglutarate aldolase
MSNKIENLQTILDAKIIAIIRADESGKLLEVVKALADGGIKALEITMTTPGALEAIKAASERFGNKILVGVGSVLDAETARAAILAGAEFIVSPVFKPEIVTLANRYSKVVLPSAYTTTEILIAWESGADLIKLFPADNGGPAYLKAIRAPLPHIPLVPVGGVTLENTADFIKAGAAAVGIGGALVKKEFLKSQDLTALTKLCVEFVENIKSVRKP